MLLPRRETANTLTPTADVLEENGAPIRSKLARNLFFALAAVALVYAFLAAFATVGDPDFGWQLARGRWMVQHHQIFSNDVLSYTVPGASAIYPAFGGIMLYGLFVLGGYSLLSWTCAIVAAGTVALLLRRGSAATAAIAILVVPFIAMRSVPRSELFAIVIFAAYVSVLWQNFQTGRAQLWWLPLLMVIWVNVHFSFFSGFGLLAAFGGMELLELPFAGDRRVQALQRLKREIPWFALTVAATLVNPWGWRIYPETLQYTKVAVAIYVNEWAPLYFNWSNPLTNFTLRNTNDLSHVLLIIIILAIAIALLQRRLGVGVLLLATLYEATHHLRLMALASCVVVVVVGSVLNSAVPWVRSRIPNPRKFAILATAIAAAFAGVGILRAADIVSNYHYLAERNLSNFGAGLAGYFPRGAVEFIDQQKLPGEVFNTYNEGGYTLWALGPDRRDYVDGREIPFGAAFLQHAAQMLTIPLDSPIWRQEADKYGINTIIFPLTLDEISLNRLRLDCNSQKWRPVYLDEVSIVLVRRTPETEDLIKRFEVGCEIAPIPREPLPLSPANFNQWVNAARVLSAMGRNSEALAAADKAMAIFPDNAHARWYRGQILYVEARHVEAEEEWKRALALSPREITPWASLPEFQAAVWSSLADLYHRDERIAEAVNALQRVTELSSDPSTKFQALANLGALEVQMGQPAAAEKHWLAALALWSNDSVIWTSLGDLYSSQKRLPEAIDAMQKAVKYSSDPAAKTNELIKIARLSLMNRQPKLALQALDEAEKTAPPDVLSVTTGRSFKFNVAQGRSVSWMALGDLPQATSFAEQAVQLDPDAPDAWHHLAKLYERQGRTADRERAEEHGRMLASSHP